MWFVIMHDEGPDIYAFSYLNMQINIIFIYLKPCQ